jgi:hypothetical protein
MRVEYVYPAAMKATTVNFMLDGWEVYVQELSMSEVGCWMMVG